MTNREKYILQRNEWDMLCGLQANLDCQCVIEALTGKEYLCADDKVCMLDTCKECIQKWLNKESD